MDITTLARCLPKRPAPLVASSIFGYCGAASATLIDCGNGPAKGTGHLWRGN